MAAQKDLESSAKSLNHQSWGGEASGSKDTTPLLKRHQRAGRAGGAGGGDQAALGMSNSASYSAGADTIDGGRGLSRVKSEVR